MKAETYFKENGVSWWGGQKPTRGRNCTSIDALIYAKHKNGDLLEKKYPCSGKNMETTWREHLSDQNKYKIISSKELLANIDSEKYADLKKYRDSFNVTLVLLYFILLLFCNTL